MVRHCEQNSGSIWILANHGYVTSLPHHVKTKTFKGSDDFSLVRLREISPLDCNSSLGDKDLQGRRFAVNDLRAEGLYVELDG